MPAPTIDELPAAPLPNDARAVFDAKAFPQVAAQANMVTQINDLVGWLNDNIVDVSDLVEVPGGVEADDVVVVYRDGVAYSVDPTTFGGGGGGSSSNLMANAVAGGDVTGSSMTITPEGSAVSSSSGSGSITIANASDYGFASGVSYVIEIVSLNPALVADSFDRIFIRLAVSGGTDADSQTVTAQPFSAYKFILEVPAGIGAGVDLTITGFQNYNYFNFAILGITAL